MGVGGSLLSPRPPHPPKEKKMTEPTNFNEEIDIKNVGEYLKYLRDGIQLNINLTADLLKTMGDFGHDQGELHFHFMETLGRIAEEYYPPDEESEEPHLKVVENDEAFTQ